jgi:hypothetical protein
MIGYNAIIEELNFIQHLHTSNKSESTSEQIVTPIVSLDDVNEYCYNSELESNNVSEIKDTNKNIIIESKQNKNKYTRTELPDEKRCEFNLPNGKRCTFKKSDDSNNCSRHSK